MNWQKFLSSKRIVLSYFNIILVFTEKNFKTYKNYINFLIIKPIYFF